ncbi:MAG: NAD(P)/FAD-dependent oxidoreductase, partial [Mogibacterium sp.]|nr:NAD(P)/FAD-dependent oxidoreductase [Mogibacterium sp.]
AYVLARAGIEPSRPVSRLTDGEIRRISEHVHTLSFRPTGIRGWKEAQCTSGGVALEELDPDTNESRLSPGLYITGELQDYDGPCGGFNLNHAWRTGLSAGRAAARSLSGSEQD